MRKEKLVSVCIPAFNQTVFLKRTLDSLCVQSYRNIEVILSDDSTDGRVEELVSGYKEKLNIVYHRNSSPLGSPANWNKCLEVAKGYFIKIVHHDDWLASVDSISDFVSAFTEHSDFVFCVSEIHNLETGRISYNIPQRNFLETLRRDPAVLFNNNRIGSPTATMYRNNGWRFDEHLKYLVDVEFYIRVLRQNQNYVFINKALIVNTSGHPAQVTAASQKREIQVGEYCYLYNRVFPGTFPGAELNIFFIKLFSAYKISRPSTIRKWGFEPPKPVWYFYLLMLLGMIRTAISSVYTKMKNSKKIRDSARIKK